jgi:hypothetical protein
MPHPHCGELPLLLSHSLSTQTFDELPWTMLKKLQSDYCRWSEQLPISWVIVITPSAVRQSSRKGSELGTNISAVITVQRNNSSNAHPIIYKTFTPYSDTYSLSYSIASFASKYLVQRQETSGVDDVPLYLLPVIIAAPGIM